MPSPLRPGERIERMYFVRYYDPIRRKRFTTSYRVTEEVAKQRFAEYPEFEILWSTVEERVLSDNPKWLPSFTQLNK